MCDCDIQRPDWDEEGEELWEENEVKAEKDISCCECCHPIKAGETYKHLRGCWDGEWSAYKMCLDCSRLSDRFTKKTDCCHALGGLYEELIDSDILLRDEEDEETWIEQESWLKVVCQHPLKCEVVEEVA
ncbi:hypothetical protein NSTC745_06423 [Nostoc sp. DSM 114161]|jgi:hypothetical protein|uniref:hypothetical protein n=1 Tax=Nostoc sp. DSM 114161 TaxID=3440143 RepID=UPI0040457D78